MYKKTFAQKLNQRLKELGKNQKWLVEQMGLEQSNISRWMSGVSFPKSTHFDRLCVLLGVEPAYFQTDKKEKYNIGSYIKKIRKDKGISQERLTELSGLSISAIQKIEQGNRWPGKSAMHALSEALGCPIELFFSKDSKNKYTSCYLGWAGAKIKARRISLGIFSQEELAERVGVSRAAVASWESGVSGVDNSNFDNLLNALEVDDSFFNFTKQNSYKELSGQLKNRSYLLVIKKMLAESAIPQKYKDELLEILIEDKIK